MLAMDFLQQLRQEIVFVKAMLIDVFFINSAGDDHIRLQELPCALVVLEGADGFIAPTTLFHEQHHFLIHLHFLVQLGLLRLRHHTQGPSTFWNLFTSIFNGCEDLVIFLQR